MPRPPNPKCVQCAKLTRDEAMQLHGSEGDGCWNAKRCDDRRYSYRTAPIRNEVRKQRRRLTGTVADTEATTPTPTPRPRSQRAVTLDLPALSAATPHAYLYYFRTAKDAPVHALMAELWLGEHRRARACFHVTGGGTVQIKAQLLHVLEEFSRLAETRVPHFRDEIELMPECCPLRPCPLHPEL